MPILIAEISEPEKFYIKVGPKETGLQLNKMKSDMKKVADLVKSKAGPCPDLILILKHADLKTKAPCLTWLVGSNLPSPDGKWPQSFQELKSLQNLYNQEKCFIQNTQSTSILEEHFNDVEMLNKQAKEAHKDYQKAHQKRRKAK